MSSSLKRESDFENPDSKRSKPLDSISEDGPLTQKDVVYFQKEAIWRQMMSYKRKCAILNKDLSQVKAKYEENENKLNILDVWYKQIITTLKGYNDFEPTEKINDNLLVKINDNEVDPKDMLEQRRVHLLKVLTPLLESSKIEYPGDQSLIQKIEEINQECCKLRAQNESLINSKNLLESSLKSVQERLLVIENNQHRNQSKTLQRIDPNKKISEVGEDKKSIEDKTENSHDSKKDEENMSHKEELESLQIELKEIQSENTKLNEQLEALTMKHNKSTADCMDLASRLSNLSESDLSASPIYKNLLLQNKRLNEELETLQKNSNISITRINEMESTQADFKKMVDQSIKNENENLKSQLAKSESDLVRIRTSRDELLAKINILKSEANNKELVNELTEMIKIQKERLDSLEGNKKAQDIACNDVDKLNSLSKEELIKRLNMMNMEIKEVEEAFQSSRELTMKKLFNEVETEHLIKKLTIEKTKADQKYFAAMRAKDALSSENKVLKGQINKSQELVSKLTDLENSYLSKIDILQKAEQDLRSIKETSIQDNHKLQEQSRSLQSKFEKYQNEIKAINLKLESKIKNLDESNRKNQDYELKIVKLETRVKEYDTLIKKYRSNNTSSILQEDEKQLEALRSIAKCSVCSKNWKDTAITVCGHVFCSDCAQERLAARLRRCPTCNKGFSANDLLSIHL